MRRKTRFFLGAVAAVTVVALGAAAYFIATYAISPWSVSRPASSKPFAGEPAKLLEVGTLRHGDTSLSPIRRSCNTCHADEDSYNVTFNVPFPHYVRSVRWKTGLSEITAEGMVQFCMVSAMQGKPLPWDSEALTALTAFVLERHRKALNRKTSSSGAMGGTCETPPG